MKLRDVFLVLLALLGMAIACSAEPPAHNNGTSGAGGSAGALSSGGAGSAGTSGGSSCGAGQLMCSGACKNITSDIANCGNCNRACGSNQVCANSVCGCPAGLLACGLACVDSTTDVMNCGMCNRACTVGQNCAAGTCSCQAGLTSCGASCADTMSDPANCGACGTACATGQVCSLGVCSATCATGLTNCEGACVDVMTAGAHCGACGSACQAGQTCAAGACSCSVAGQTSCGGLCVDTQSSATNCGSCGNACGGGQTCNAGVCTCPVAGQTSCGGQCTDTQTSGLHCGTCDHACATGETCSAGVCTCPVGASCGAGGTSGAGGTAGASGAGGSGGTTTRPPECPADPLLLSDFEEGTGTLVPQGGRTGWWYVFADMLAGAQTPPNVDGPVAVQPSGETAMCNQYAFQSTATGHTQYVGFGATFSPVLPIGSEGKNPLDVSAYTGVSFRIKSGSGNAPPVYFELLNKETQPAPAGTATNNAVDMYNTRGKVLTGIGTTWTTVNIPFGLLAPRYLPGDPACAAGVFCEAPKFNPLTALGIQFSVYDQFTAAGAYNLWVDDVKFYTGDAGIATYTQTGSFPFPRNAALGNSCTKPAGADGKYLIDMFLKWKATFVTSDGAGSGGLRVKRTEAQNDSVSEGIAYGMLIAVYMGDKPLFDGLWTYWAAHSAATGPLMHWQINSGGGTQGSGSASDADQDAAFALLMAAKQWGGDYQSRAVSMINGIWNSDTDGSPRALNGGSSFPSVRNPSYFAPAFYREFAKVDSAHAWSQVIDSSYTMINSISGSNGLVPAWCSNNCTSRGGTSHTDGDKYQYDSHRTPWRIGLDFCWNGETRARTYTQKTSDFFASKATSGVGQVWDIYDGSGNQTSNAKKNSMSIIGTAASGAMVTAGGSAGHKKFLDSGYQFILDASYFTPALTQTADQTAYTYYNATVGLLTALTMSGNFNLFQ